MLLDHGPDAVDYLPQVVAEGEYGEDVVGFGDPIPLRVELQRLSSEEAAAITTRAGVSAGGPVRVMYRFSTRRDLPSGAGAHVVALGRRWEVVGEPTVQGRSLRTRHTRVVIRALTEGA